MGTAGLGSDRPGAEMLSRSKSAEVGVRQEVDPFHHINESVQYLRTNMVTGHSVNEFQ